MLLRMRNVLRRTPDAEPHQVPTELLKDLQWWSYFLPRFDNVSYMWMSQELEPDSILATDACMEAMGAVCFDRGIHVMFPEEFLNPEVFIHHLEMIALVVSLKHWKNQLKGKRFVVQCDNKIVVDTLSGQFSRDVLLQQWMRECAFVCAVGKFEIIVKYINTKDNVGPDLLSRKHKTQNFDKKFNELVGGNIIFEEVDLNLFNVSSTW